MKIGLGCSSEWGSYDFRSILFFQLKVPPPMDFICRLCLCGTTSQWQMNALQTPELHIERHNSHFLPLSVSCGLLKNKNAAFSTHYTFRTAKPHQSGSCQMASLHCGAVTVGKGKAHFSQSYPLHKPCHIWHTKLPVVQLPVSPSLLYQADRRDCI